MAIPKMKKKRNNNTKQMEFLWSVNWSFIYKIHINLVSGNFHENDGKMTINQNSLRHSTLLLLLLRFFACNILRSISAFARFTFSIIFQRLYSIALTHHIFHALNIFTIQILFVIQIFFVIHNSFNIDTWIYTRYGNHYVINTHMNRIFNRCTVCQPVVGFWIKIDTTNYIVNWKAFIQKCVIKNRPKLQI